MSKHRKKPVVIDAIQWTGDNDREVEAFFAYFDPTIPGVRLMHAAFGGIDADDCVVINTLEGTMNAHPGDWIIKGVKGEFYPCKPDIFEATYEPAEVDGRVED